MEKVKIFLASSAELNEDKELFEMFISKKNKEWHDKRVFLELLTWNDFIEAMSQTRLQDDYNQAIRESRIFVVLFHTRLGRYTNEEFEIAYDQFEKTKSPLIYTYFKEEGRIVDPAIEAFKDKLDKLGHFYGLYKNNDELKYKFDMQLDKLGNDGVIKFNTVDLAKNIKYLLFFIIIPVLVLSLTYRYFRLHQPYDLTVMVNETKGIPNLPFNEGKVTMTYGEKQEQITITKENGAVFKELPPYLRGEMARIKIEANGFLTSDTLIKLKDKGITIPVIRDESLSIVFGMVKDEANKPLMGVEIMVKDLLVFTDESGHFKVKIPLEKQQQEQRLTAHKNGYQLWDYSFPVMDDKEVKIILQQ